GLVTHDAGNILVQANYDFSLDGHVLEGTTTTKVPVQYTRPDDLSTPSIAFTYDKRTDPTHPVLEYDGTGYLYGVRNNRGIAVDLLKSSASGFNGRNLVAFTAAQGAATSLDVIAANQANVFWRTDFNAAAQHLNGGDAS